MHECVPLQKFCFAKRKDLGALCYQPTAMFTPPVSCVLSVDVWMCACACECACVCVCLCMFMCFVCVYAYACACVHVCIHMSYRRWRSHGGEERAATFIYVPKGRPDPNYPPNMWGGYLICCDHRLLFTCVVNDVRAAAMYPSCFVHVNVFRFAFLSRVHVIFIASTIPLKEFDAID